MHISHPVVGNKIYELIKTVEFDVTLGDDGFTVRIELFRSTTNVNHFRAHIWRSEFFRIQSTFPQDGKTHQPADQPSDELIFTDYSSQFKGRYSDFQAESEDVALQVIFDDYKSFLKHVTLE
jgi:hypothetical protein